MSKVEEFVQEYRHGGSQRLWDDPSQMSVPELYEYLIHCEASRDRYQGMLYAWATDLELKDVPASEIQCMVEDLTFVSGQVESLREALNQPVNIVNTDGVFLVRACETLTAARNLLGWMESTTETPSDEAAYEVERMQVCELITYWECVLADHGISEKEHTDGFKCQF